MYCPACGADAGDAKFCPECGADLKSLAAPPVCAACGSEIPKGARFCPECGEPARGAPGGRARDAVPEESGEAAAPGSGGGRRTGTRGKGAGARQQRRLQPRAGRPVGGQDNRAATKPGGRVSPAVTWGVIAAVAAVAIVVVVFYAAGRGGSGTAASPGSQSPTPVVADTTGAYSDLVTRANSLYDQGTSKYNAKQYAQGGVFFAAAATVYAAALKQQSTDPGVGTDFATALFYSGKVDAAIAQVDRVLAQSPQFQTAWFNKGNYLAEKGRQTTQAGNAKAAKAAYAGARAAYQKAIDLGPATSSGQQAKQQLGKLPK